MLDKMFEERKCGGEGGYVLEDESTAFEEERAQRVEEERKRGNKPVGRISPIKEVENADANNENDNANNENDDGSDEDVFA